ncbi:septal ring lytic transglycosylase RlpA family protein [Ralstonia sp. RL]|uniref:septal ring lytic transglycosylase RlpA family protein n=1 Tax=Ralstonia sp. RL TaxID=1839756 RepID=UPI000AFF3472|nr:septal ring lytic transglycosylase RlpA family protein [Ralstonia sp. RL]
MNMPMRTFLSLTLVCACSIGATAFAGQAAASDSSQPAGKTSRPKHDAAAKPLRGKASYYSRKFAGKKMADGTRMNPHAAIAASKTLPLGSKAKVTNLENGKSAEVEIRDRGPYVDGRIVDVSPRVADMLGMEDQGVVPVEVRPIERARQGE